jgi:hypothetical protein
MSEFRRQSGTHPLGMRVSNNDPDRKSHQLARRSVVPHVVSQSPPWGSEKLSPMVQKAFCSGISGKEDIPMLRS